MKNVLTPEEVASALGLSRRTIITWLQEGKLPGVKVGNRWRVKEEDLDKFLDEPNMFFKDYVHQARFMELREKTNAQTPEMLSFIYVMACLSKPLDEFISELGANSEKIQRASRYWGATERALVKLALGLLDPDEAVDMNEVFTNLDRKSMEAALQAIRLRW